MTITYRASILAEPAQGISATDLYAAAFRTCNALTITYRGSATRVGADQVSIQVEFAGLNDFEAAETARRAAVEVARLSRSHPTVERVVNLG